MNDVISCLQKFVVSKSPTDRDQVLTVSRAKMLRVCEGILKLSYRHRAEDAAQEALTRLDRRLEGSFTAHEIQSFGSYIYTIAQNCAIDELNKIRRRRTVEADAGAMKDPSVVLNHENPLSLCENRELSERIGAFLSQHTDSIGVCAFQMHALDKKSFQEIADALDFTDWQAARRRIYDIIAEVGRAFGDRSKYHGSMGFRMPTRQ